MFHIPFGYWNHRILKMKCRAHWQRYIQAIAHASNEDIFEFHGCQARGAADAGMWGRCLKYVKVGFMIFS